MFDRVAALFLNRRSRRRRQDTSAFLGYIPSATSLVMQANGTIAVSSTSAETLVFTTNTGRVLGTAALAADEIYELGYFERAVTITLLGGSTGLLNFFLVGPYGQYLSFPLGNSDPYAVLSQYSPPLVGDFINEIYRVDGTSSTFDAMFDVSTTGLETMVDSDGLRKWNAHNYYSRSQEFDHAMWSKNGATVAADALTAPDGTMTADTLTATATNNFTFQSLTFADGQQLTVS